MSRSRKDHGYAVVRDLLAEAERRFPAGSRRHNVTLRDDGSLVLGLAVGSSWCEVGIDEKAKTPTAFLDHCEKQSQVVAARGTVTRSDASPVRGAISEEGEDAHGRFVMVTLGEVVQRFRWVAPGKFMMGSPASEAGRWEDEGPQHEVELTRGYWMADTPVTQALWTAVMGQNPSRYPGAQRPVERVSWEDCQRFVAKLNGLVPGLNARLPSEAEWEYACRAGTTGATWMGELDIQGDGIRASVLDSIAVYYGNSPDGTQPVRSKAPNPLGLYDMLGNVYEWCGDWFTDYDAAPAIDPHGPKVGSRRVERGGCWFSDARFVRAADRYAYGPAYRGDDLGFRLARGHQV